MKIRLFLTLVTILHSTCHASDRSKKISTHYSYIPADRDETEMMKKDKYPPTIFVEVSKKNRVGTALSLCREMEAKDIYYGKATSYRALIKDFSKPLYSGEYLKPIGKTIPPDLIEPWLSRRKTAPACNVLSEIVKADKWLFKKCKGRKIPQEELSTLKSGLNDLRKTYPSISSGQIRQYLNKSDKSYKYPAVLALQTRNSGTKHETGTITFYEKDADGTIFRKIYNPAKVNPPRPINIQPTERKRV